MSHEPQQLSKRLTSLDVFRRIAIAGMILVNMAGVADKVYPLRSYLSDGLSSVPSGGLIGFGLSKDYELDTHLSEAMIYGSLIRLMLKRLTT